jgi:hypothetical protein
MNSKKFNITPENKIAAFLIVYVCFIFFAQALLKLKSATGISKSFISNRNSSFLKPINE